MHVLNETDIRDLFLKRIKSVQGGVKSGSYRFFEVSARFDPKNSLFIFSFVEYCLKLVRITSVDIRFNLLVLES